MAAKQRSSQQAAGGSDPHPEARVRELAEDPALVSLGVRYTRNAERVAGLQFRLRCGATLDAAAADMGISERQARAALTRVGISTPGSSRRRQPDPIAEERNTSMVRAREAGATLDEIASQHGLSPERVRQVLHQMGGPTTADVRAIRDKTEQQRLDLLGGQLHDVLTQLGTAPNDQVCVEVECSPEDLRRAIRESDRWRLITPRRSVERFGHRSIMDGLQELSRLRAREQGLDGLVRVPKAAWDDWRDPDTLPSSIRIMQRYGTWIDACITAGVPVLRHERRSGAPRQWTDDQLVQWLARFVADPAGGRSVAEFDRWARSHRDAPSSQTVRNRLGGWNAARKASAAYVGRTTG